jgi:beta-phosphoglucomutase
MPVRAIVFDFDGVLADSEPLHLRTYQELLEPAGVRLTPEVYCEKYLGFDDEGAFQQIAIDNNLMLGDEEIELLIAEKARRFARLIAGTDVLYPGAAACARRLAAAWPIAIASGALRSEI